MEVKIKSSDGATTNISLDIIPRVGDHISILTSGNPERYKVQQVTLVATRADDAHANANGYGIYVTPVAATEAVLLDAHTLWAYVPPSPKKGAKKKKPRTKGGGRK